MPSFTIKSSDRLAQNFHGMTDEMAGEMWAFARALESGTSYTALRYTVSRNGKTHKAATLIVLTIDGDDSEWARIITDEYHPRKQGKADLDFQTDYVYIDND
jgi:hypothetical protein